MDNTKIKSAVSEQHVTDTIKNLKALTDSVYEINKKMYRQLVEIIKSNGGFVRTYNEDYDMILGFVLDEDLDRYIDKKVLAVKVDEDDDLCVLLGEFYEEFDDDETDEQILGRDDWYAITGGMMLVRPTLYNLCDCIWEYLDDEKVNGNDDEE
jgi:hypothetical protein